MMRRFSLILGGVLALLLIVIITGARVVGMERDRNELSYVFYQGFDSPSIMLLDIDHQIRRNLTPGDHYNSDPAWSPDGEWIAFVSDRAEDGEFGVYVMDATGGRLRRLTQGRSYNAPRWSADGSRLIFFARTGNRDLYGINADGSDLRQLTGETNSLTGIMMDLGIEIGASAGLRSPDRQHTLYLDYADRQWGVYLTHNDNGGAYGRREAGMLIGWLGREYTQFPVWSADGRRVAYVSTHAGSPDLFIADVLPTPASPRRLTHSREYEFFAAFRP